MSQPTYRIPTTNVFLQADGMVVPRPLDGATVINATLGQAPMLTAAYVGAGLHFNEKGLGDTILDDLGAKGSERATLKHLVEMTEFLVLVGDAIELGHKLADWMGWLGPAKPDPVIALLEWLDRRLNQIEDSVLQAWASSRRDMLALLRSHSSTALRFAQEYLELGRPQNDSVWAAKAALADRDSLLAVNTFIDSGIDGGFWLRPFSLKALGINPNAVYSSWLGFYPDQAQVMKNPVWDYRFTLPAAAYAIVVRLAVLRAFSPESLVQGRAGCREMRRCARFLREVAERMQSGIWAIEDLPDLSDWGRFQFLWSGLTHVAAANIYSGYAFFRKLYAYDLVDLPSQDPALWPAGLIDAHEAGGGNEQIIARGRENARRIGRHWWSLVWRGIGMVEVCQLISDVEAACTPPRYVSLIGQAQRMLLTAMTNPKAKKAASVATALARFASESDAVADANRTFQLYQSLQAGGERAQRIVARCTEELLRLAPPHPQPGGPHVGEREAPNSRRKPGSRRKPRKSGGLRA
jgi:hypothetical protein